MLGLRLSGCKLHNYFLAGSIGAFNRLYQEYYLTVYCGLDLEPEESAATLVLKSHWNYASWCASTEGHFKHAQLVWDCIPPTLHWLGSAVDWTAENLAKNTLAGTTEEEATSSTGEDKDSKLFQVFKHLTGMIKD